MDYQKTAHLLIAWQSLKNSGQINPPGEPISLDVCFVVMDLRWNATAAATSTRE
jgi:hypothetical protein